MSVKCETIDIAALIDTGSSINILSIDLFNCLSNNCKSGIFPFDEEIVLADGSHINIIGTATVKIRVDNRLSNIKVYLLPKTSHPMILGMDYLRSRQIEVTFKDIPCGNIYKIKADKRLKIDPESELIVWGQLPKDLSVGLQGICENNKFLMRKNLLLAKTLVTIPVNHLVPIKIMNPSADVVVIPKGSILSDFHVLDDDFDIFTDSDHPSVYNNVNSVNNVDQIGQPVSEFSDFIDEFKFADSLTETQKQTLAECLYQNRDIFVTKDNPNLGFTDTVQHKIILKPDAKPKHQRPYRLPPQKREVLRHHLDELLRQGIIAPVNEGEDVPITSPIVLVSKRAKSSKSNLSEKEVA